METDSAIRTAQLPRLRKFFENISRLELDAERSDAVHAFGDSLVHAEFLAKVYDGSNRIFREPPPVLTQALLDVERRFENLKTTIEHGNEPAPKEEAASPERAPKAARERRRTPAPRRSRVKKVAHKDAPFSVASIGASWIETVHKDADVDAPELPAQEPVIEEAPVEQAPAEPQPDEDDVPPVRKAILAALQGASKP